MKNNNITPIERFFQSDNEIVAEPYFALGLGIQMQYFEMVKDKPKRKYYLVSLN